MMSTLRPYQQQAHKAIRDNLAAGVYHQLIQAATGTGKTVIFSQLPDEIRSTHPGKMLVLAHREELIDQAITKMRQVNPSLRIDKEMAEHRADPSQADVVVASVATLGRKDSPRLLGYNWSLFDKIVIDEAHHSTSQTYLNILEAAGVFDPCSIKLLLGVTATPVRGDGQALAKVFQKIVFSYPMRQAIEEGYLVDVRGIKVTTRTSLDGIKVSKGDYDQTQLANTVNTPERNQQIVKAWLDHAKCRPTIGFTVDIQHAKDLAGMFQHHGIAAEALWGDDPERAEKITRLRSGATTVLVNCSVLVEGFDEPTVGCVIMARPTKSSVLFTQSIGRATRLSPGKKDCLILDVVDSSSRNSLITLPTLLGMNPKVDIKGKSLVGSVKQLEEAQKKFPHIDFSTLEDIGQIEQFVQDVNLFQVQFPAEVEGNSALSWYPSPTGGYVLMLPGWETGRKTPYGKPEVVSERIEIKQNLLDTWDITGSIRGRKVNGERPTIETVFAAVDEAVAKLYPDALRLLKREEKWHKEPVSPGQLRLLKKFFKGKAIPADLSKGQASKLISSHLAGKG